MQFGWNLIWFIIAVSLLVTIHEYGHFWVARKFGFKVLRFSVGFGKPLWKKVGAAPDHTEFVIAALPLGGYVKLLDEREGFVAPEELPRAFTRKPPWQRILVLLAGPAANLLFAVLVLWAVFWYSGETLLKPIVGEVRSGSIAASAGLRAGDEILTLNGETVRDHGDVVLGLMDRMSDGGEVALSVKGSDGRRRELQISVADAAQRYKLTEPTQITRGLGLQFWRPPTPAVIGTVESGGPAELAGLKSGDRVVAIDGNPVRSFEEFALAVRAKPGQSVVISYDRQGQRNNVRVTTVRELDAGREIGRLKIGPANMVEFPPELRTQLQYGPLEALQRSFAEAWRLTVTQAKFLVRMLMGQVSAKNLSGPVSIADYAGKSASAGIGTFISFLVMISLSLGFLNLLPIPILDGGQILYQLAEWIKGGPLSDRAQMVGQSVGIALLVLLMGVALFNDLTGVFGAR